MLIIRHVQYWVTENPHWMREHHFYCLQKLSVWNVIVKKQSKGDTFLGYCQCLTRISSHFTERQVSFDRLLLKLSVGNESEIEKISLEAIDGVKKILFFTLCCYLIFIVIITRLCIIKAKFSLILFLHLNIKLN